MAGRMAGLLHLGLLLATAAASPGSAQTEARDLDARARDAYRAGEYESAGTLWELELDRLSARSLSTNPRQRARILYNMGNASYRAGELMLAVGWYSAALRLATRDGDLWANLELARSEAGLEPADRGDLAATTRRVLSAFTRAESEWLVLLGTALLALALGGEALRGGLLWRSLSRWAVLGLALLSAPLLFDLVHAGEHPMLVVAPDGATARAEPRSEAKSIDRLEAGIEVAYLDRLPGWVQVADDEGRRLWVRDAALFDLSR